ncbi:MAG TPA: hypothetical protein VFZ34_33565, partial [Blastocatellia bacterium]|nr:hypothetical protein [Blastocatellia bacterium]
MKFLILTLWVMIPGLVLGALAPKSSQLNESNKAAIASPLPSFVVSEEVTFKGDNIVLSGTLFLPKSKAGQKVPAVMMVTDFYSLRDGVKFGSAQHNSYRDLAIHLVERGFA